MVSKALVKTKCYLVRHLGPVWGSDGRAWQSAFSVEASAAKCVYREALRA